MCMEIEAAAPNNEMRKQRQTTHWGKKVEKMGTRTHKVKSRRKLQREGRQAGASKCCAIINERINYEINGESRVSWP